MASSSRPAVGWSGGRVVEELAHGRVVEDGVVVPPPCDGRVGPALVVDQRREPAVVRPSAGLAAQSGDRGGGKGRPVDDPFARERALEQGPDERRARLERAAEHGAEQAVAGQDVPAVPEQEHGHVVEGGHQPEQPGVGTLLPARARDPARAGERGHAGLGRGEPVAAGAQEGTQRGAVSSYRPTVGSRRAVLGGPAVPRLVPPWCGPAAPPGKVSCPMTRSPHSLTARRSSPVPPAAPAPRSAWPSPATEHRSSWGPRRPPGAGGGGPDRGRRWEGIVRARGPGGQL